MSRRVRNSLAVVVLMLGAMVASTGIAAAEAFLCPVVGDGVLNADAHNGDGGVSAVEPPVGTSFLPGNNQAGANANDSAHNTLGPSDPNAGPGGNSDFSPIWPG